MEAEENEIKTPGSLAGEILGATHIPLYATRKVKTYPIQEHELDAIGDLNKNATIWYSIMAGSLTLLAGCAWDMISSGSAASVNQWGFCFLFLSVTIASFFLAKSYEKTRETRLEKIKSESDLG